MYTHNIHIIDNYKHRTYLKISLDMLRIDRV